MELATAAQLSSATDPASNPPSVIVVAFLGGIQIAYRLTPEEADTFADQMKVSAKEARTGLHLATPLEVPAHHNGSRRR